MVPNGWSLMDLNFLKLEKPFEDVKSNLKHFCILRFFYVVFFLTYQQNTPFCRDSIGDGTS